jgi:sugar lactone lactonase YvrE
LASADINQAANAAPKTQTKEATRQNSTAIAEVAKSSKQWTGVAVDKSGSLFVNFPRWSDDVPVAVGKINAHGTVEPFPNAAWNSWKPGEKSDQKFVCVQAVYVDRSGNLWVLDPASPKMQGVVAGGAKLVSFDPKTGKELKRFKFDSAAAPEKSYLNDVRFDSDMRHAFITDSGLGAIVVLDLATGKARRLLSTHESTKSERLPIVINGTTWTRDGKQPSIAADGIAVDKGGKYLYYDALTARTLYRIPIAALLNEKLSEKDLSAKVEKLTAVGPNDGLEDGPGDYIYVTDLQQKAVTRWKPGMKQPEVVVKDDRLSWPDSLAVGPAGEIYVSCSRIHEGSQPKAPYVIFKFKIDK